MALDTTSFLLGKKKGGSGPTPTYQSKDVSITENGTTTITPDTGYDALSDVDVTVSGILDTSDADAVASDMAISKTAYVNGTKITGNVPVGSSSVATNYASNNVGTYLDDLQVDTEQGNQNQMFRTGDKISVYAPLSDVAPVIGASAEKIKKDEVICGVTGTYEGGGGGLNWNAIGFSSTPETITTGYNYAKDMYDNWDSSVTSIPSQYRDSRGQILVIPALDMSNITSLSSALAYQQHLIEIGPITVSNKCTSLERFCYYDYGLKKIDFTNIDLSNVTGFSQTFYNCSSLEILKNLKNKSVNKLQTTQGMFYACTSDNFKSIDLSEWQNVDLWTSAQQMFYVCGYLEDVKVNLKNVNNMNQMFYDCRKLKNIEFGNFTGGTLINAQNAFYNCRALNNDTLNRILGLCINATNVSTKTLAYLGFNSSYQPVSVLETLPNYQAFLAAGWTVGY